MSNHFHLVIETPRPNLVSGMKWLLGTYTMRFNRRHRLCGHLFAGRYKSLLIDESAPGYLRTVCDYVHLNPVRAGLIPPDEPLERYFWSSYPAYLQPPASRPPWLRCDRLLGEHGLQEETRRDGSSFGVGSKRAGPTLSIPRKTRSTAGGVSGRKTSPPGCLIAWSSRVLARIIGRLNVPRLRRSGPSDWFALA